MLAKRNPASGGRGARNTDPTGRLIGSDNKASAAALQAVIPDGSYVRISKTFRALTFDVARYLRNPEKPGFQVKWCATFADYEEARREAQVRQARGYYLKDDVGEAGRAQ